MNEEIHISEKLLIAASEKLLEKSVLLFRVEFAITPQGMATFLQGDAGYRDCFDERMGKGWYDGVAQKIMAALAESEAERVFAQELLPALKRMDGAWAPDGGEGGTRRG